MESGGGVVLGCCQVAGCRRKFAPTTIGGDVVGSKKTCFAAECFLVKVLGCWTLVISFLSSRV